MDVSRFLTKGNKQSGQFLIRQEAPLEAAIDASAAPPMHYSHQQMEEPRTPLNMKTDIRTSQHSVGVRGDVVLLSQ